MAQPLKHPQSESDYAKVTIDISDYTTETIILPRRRLSTRDGKETEFSENEPNQNQAGSGSVRSR